MVLRDPLFLDLTTQINTACKGKVDPFIIGAKGSGNYRKLKSLDGIEFKASDGTKCDLSFTTLKDAEKQHEVLIAMLLGSPWLDASGNRMEPMTLPPTLKESLQLLLPLVGITIHYNSHTSSQDIGISSHMHHVGDLCDSM